jgi:hypothetical protein
VIFRANVQGGTGAGRKSRPDPTVAHCACGHFIAKARADRGATKCLGCSSGVRVYERSVQP